MDNNHCRWPFNFRVFGSLDEFQRFEDFLTTTTESEPTPQAELGGLFIRRALAAPSAHRAMLLNRLSQP